MRIIAGEHRGRRLFAPEGDETRPTGDKVKEALFSIIRSDVPDAEVLDLFAGSGALSLEALSRGAKSAVLCDKSKKAVAVIKRNVEMVGYSDRARIITGDWQTAVAGKFSLVFLDPPYRMHEVYAEAANRLLSGGHLTDDALIVMEHSADMAVEGLDPAFEITFNRAYRDTALTLVRLKKEEGEGE